MLRRLASEEQGVALVLALLAMFVLSGLTAAALTVTALNHRNAKVSADSNHAFALAEQGVAYAEGRLYSAATSGEPVLVPQTTFSQDGGTVTYVGTLSGSTWTLTGTGVYGGVTRNVSVQADVPPPYTVSDPTIWNYLYADSHTATCAAAFNGNVSITVPLYSQGNLCFDGNVKYKGADLEVGGNLSMIGAVSIGAKTAPISKMNVHGACSVSPCDGAHDPVWVAGGVGTTLDPQLTMPAIDLASAYATQMAATTTGCPSNFFDNDTQLNDSLGSANLFPSGTSYDCFVGSNELKWDGHGGLTVNGVFLFDGNLSLSGSVDVVYSGSGTIYFDGTMATSGNVSICGVTGSADGKTCTANWNPNTNGLILAAGCANASGACVDWEGNTYLQIGTYATGAFTEGGNVVDMGPVIADTLDLNGNTGVMLPFHTLPPGAPTDTKTVTPPPGPPTNWSG
ncbi:MAG TPA: hypothetical protein VF186_04505 [Gaiellaceae bacterium]